MNETPPPPLSASTSHIDPMGLDDPALLAEIEAEFADLTAEIQRISAMPRSMAPDKHKLLEALRETWRNRMVAIGDQPEWRKKLDDTIRKAVDRLLDDGLVENADGSIAFAMKGETLQEAGGPVIRGLLESFAHILEEKFPAAEKAPAPAPDAAPQSTMTALMGNLGQVLAGALRTAIANTTPSGPWLAAAMKGGGTSFDIKMSSEPPKPAASSGEPSAVSDLASEQTMHASFEMETRSKFSNRDPNAPPPEAAAAPATSKPSPVANAFFAQLMQGIGQAVSKAVTPKVETPAPAAAAPPEEGGTHATEAPAAAVSPSAAVAAAPANPLGNLGTLLAEALQKALAPNSQVILQQVPASSPKTTPPATTPPTHAADGSPVPDSPDSTVPPPVAEAAAPDAHPSDEPKAPTLQIDFAGLLNQILGGKKPPTT